MKTGLVIYEDRLSDLFDCVLLRILSNLNTKEAVQTCILSTRWKNLWKSLTVFSLSSKHFKTLKGFTKFVRPYLALRDEETALHALNLYRGEVWSNVENHPLVLLNWLVELALMESLTVYSTTLKVLSLVPDLWKIDFPYLCNLKSLKVNTYWRSSIPDRMIDFFRKNASSVEVDININQHLS
ncbi:hypothetical protein TSUD_408230 [Trifolium subterraneum]|uniref:F-box domain-containing protein n=1 Tax=Trifolium subterraneum TaxID=3900 RepID=A0A2Z6P0H3_TRISU|nr:hypothetical protein TSUD_408230 [Trifolium subterraneum]